MNHSTIYAFNSIAELMRYLIQPSPAHPLISIMKYDAQNRQIGTPGDRISLDFYKISFKTSFSGKIKYGQSYYDFEDGGLAFIAPRQIVFTPDTEYGYEGYSLFFHPDFLRKYPLMNTIQQYGFFHYSTSEALFLSAKEKKVVEALFNSMQDELNNNIDAFSQDILITQIEQLLAVSNRFYNRQFITQRVVNNDLIARMEKILSDHFAGEQVNEGLPTVQQIADALHVSPHYLGDMLRSVTGQNTQQHIHSMVIEKAKEMLSVGTLTVAEVAYQLGFGQPQSFNKLFKRKTGVTPMEYRKSFN
ncbi:helix-turn-helix domain-containing protein [Dawidia cretensis]|nr:helix-turn-helix transcriptional regulator [Dawidia cretensis]